MPTLNKLVAFNTKTRMILHTILNTILNTISILKDCNSFVYKVIVDFYEVYNCLFFGETYTSNVKKTFISNY